MANRRGLPREILSDNGGNFVGGNKELSDLVKELDQDKNPPQIKESNGNLLPHTHLILDVLMRL